MNKALLIVVVALTLAACGKSKEDKFNDAVRGSGAASQPASPASPAPSTTSSQQKFDEVL